jgi:beta-phosphoglucomutase-like phosphatase (HAD superfamily)
MNSNQPAFLFDLDGTLVDSVYQHVVAWREALASVGINLPVWKIHRRIGMSGGLFVNALARELHTDLDRETLDKLPSLHADAYVRHFDSVRPLPGAIELLATLIDHGVPWAIATSGQERYARLAVEQLGLPPETPLVTRDQVRYAKPDPDLFLTAATGSTSTSATAWSSATAFGTCSRPGERARWALVCSRVATAARS